GIRVLIVTGVQTCALPICHPDHDRLLVRVRLRLAGEGDADPGEARERARGQQSQDWGPESHTPPFSVLLAILAAFELVSERRDQIGRESCRGREGSTGGGR